MEARIMTYGGIIVRSKCRKERHFPGTSVVPLDNLDDY